MKLSSRGLKEVSHLFVQRSVESLRREVCGQEWARPLLQARGWAVFIEARSTSAHALPPVPGSRFEQA